MKDDYTTNSHYLRYTFIFRKVGRKYILNLVVKGLNQIYRLTFMSSYFLFRKAIRMLSATRTVSTLYTAKTLSAVIRMASYGVVVWKYSGTITPNIDQNVAYMLLVNLPTDCLKCHFDENRNISWKPPKTLENELQGPVLQSPISLIPD